MHGLTHTDLCAAPYTGAMTALELAGAWVEDKGHFLTGQLAEGHKFEDGVSWAWCVAHFDWDYHYGWLLEIRTHDETSDYLAVYKRHGGPGVTAVEWWNHPKPIFGTPNREQEAAEWFVGWVYVEKGREWA